MRYSRVFDELTDTSFPRRKHSPDPNHWLWYVHFAGVRIGHRAYRILARSPLTILLRGVRNGWGWDN
jgi:hypothetical protein